MTGTDAFKADLVTYLQEARDVVLLKLDGLSEYDARRPLTPTGTNLLGLVKHLALVELGYFGAIFGRPAAEAQAWVEDALEPNADLWATAEESREAVIAETHRHAGHADIVRELVDGASGLRADNDNLPPGADRSWWESYRNRLETVAKDAAGE